MIRKFFLMIGLSLGLWRPVNAQATNEAYDKKLNKLYRFTVPTIQPAELQSLLSENDNVILLDTRTPKEFEVSHLPGAKFVHFDQFKKKDVASLDKNAKVVVYCTVGYRSERIGEKLQKMGFSDVSNLYGGIFEWKNQDHAVVNKTGSETESVHAFDKDWGQWLLKGEKVFK
ncbi:MAG: rhodanese-like domain-containing protein [Bacteroidota bacterium]